MSVPCNSVADSSVIGTDLSEAHSAPCISQMLGHDRRRLSPPLPSAGAEALLEPKIPPIATASEKPAEPHSLRASPAWLLPPLVPIGAYLVSRLGILAAAGLATSVKHG